MNLLPKEHQEFVKPEYWEKFFKKRGTRAFEWYGEYPELCGVLHKYIKPKDNLLVIGCGNSKLSADLYDVSYRNITNIDISDTVIRQMKDQNEKDRPDMKFLKMDVLNMEFYDGEYSVVLDKGTLDALMVDESDKVVADIDQMFSEIDRVIKLMGRYICISLLQEHILRKIVRYFSERSWAVRIHKINTDNSEGSEKDFNMPVFAVVCTKFKKNPQLPQILEVCNHEDKTERLPGVAELVSAVQQLQYFAVVRQRISQRKVTEEQLQLALYSNSAATPRYTLTMVDSASKQHGQFAIFIVPQGRETEWMFSTDAGRLQLSSSAGFDRLVVVSLHRNHVYNDLDAIQAELSAKVMELAPPGFKQGKKVPFLSLGNDIGSRHIVKQGSSNLSGEYVIEEVQGDAGKTFRRLVFLANQNIVQSEARLKTVNVKKKGKGRQSSIVVDKSYLACQHHVAMVAGMSCVQSGRLTDLLEGDMSVLLIGLGGGGLPTYIHQYFPQVHLDVVDIDPEMVTVATEWFGFRPDDQLKVHVDDGLKFIQQEAKKGPKRHVIMLDVDSKDVSLGMSCPPAPFVEAPFLQDICNCLVDQGVLVLNLVSRDSTLKAEVIQRLKDIFPAIFVSHVEEEVNEIVFAIKDTNSAAVNQMETKDVKKDGTKEKDDKAGSGENMVNSGKTEEANEDRNKRLETLKNKVIEQCKMLDRFMKKQTADKPAVDLIDAFENLLVT
ncbi:eEF1A lysine and N-terminal methyltransferase-like [Mya arenaria]|uniref:eEF1A lysine and N-terminal methyltransferase-like n=1 Tax=Mya arenaria TaxID=6604 RepID=UPI0022E6BCBE|nr:eEF1A lysine and N-terminal methyltransferase-like [Mya arenaria]XP_052790205.1 eEF1A lysine and N-terminal methyltransferase-like [Mya arenaria]XP_052790208.1 eEF1A lysine and N-terminal methyltransferase-like [Mya arenaria]